VAGHVTLGLDVVLAELAESGFDAEWAIVPASWAGAPHRRERVIIVAHTNGDELRHEQVSITRGGDTPQPSSDGRPQHVADPLVNELHGGEHHSECSGVGAITARELGRSRCDAGRPNGDWWSSEPDVGRVAHGIPNRVDRLRCLGNAVVPQVAQWIGERIMEAAP
jgi:DNA (cytosine-5)-methyltransferase 1